MIYMRFALESVFNFTMQLLCNYNAIYNAKNIVSVIIYLGGGDIC